MRDINFVYEGVDVRSLDSINLEIAAVSMAGFIGASGAGKSTLLKLIALIERPSRGTVLVGKKNTSRVKRRRIPQFRRQLGIVFQDHKLLTDRTVFDNVALPLVIGALRRREIGRRVRAALDQVGLLGYENHAPQALSAGEQQRVCIARAIASRPDLVIADEPTGNLYPKLARETLGLFERFNEVGVTVLIATHDLQLIDERKQRILKLDGGKIVAEAAP